MSERFTIQLEEPREFVVTSPNCLDSLLVRALRQQVNRDKPERFPLLVRFVVVERERVGDGSIRAFDIEAQLEKPILNYTMRVTQRPGQNVWMTVQNVLSEVAGYLADIAHVETGGTL